MTGAEVCVYEFMMRTRDVPLGEQTSRRGPKEEMGGTVEKKERGRLGEGVCVCVSVCVRACSHTPL